jgi:hypothetical protein
MRLVYVFDAKAGADFSDFGEESDLVVAVAGASDIRHLASNSRIRAASIIPASNKSFIA